MDYHESIEKLAHDAGVVIDTTEVTNVMSASSQPLHHPPMLYIPEWPTTRPEQEMLYWISLHELGHIAHKHGPTKLERAVGVDIIAAFGGDPGKTLQELEAWEWAVSHSQVPFDKIAGAIIGSAMVGYIHNHGYASKDVSRLSKLFERIGPQVDWSIFGAGFGDPEQMTFLEHVKNAYPATFDNIINDAKGGK